MSSTQSARTQGVDDVGLDLLGEDAIAELMGGAPDEFAAPDGPNPVIAADNSGPEIGEPVAPAGKVALRNLRYINEVVFLPVNGEIVASKYVEFVDGTLVTDQATADRVKAICPYVKQEPEEGQVFAYKGFRTRVPEIYEQYVRYYNENVEG